MAKDVVVLMTELWTELREGITKLDAKSSEAEVEPFLERVVLLAGIERQGLYDALEEFDDEGDIDTAKGMKRGDAIQAAMEELSFPLPAKAWKAFAAAVTAHVEKSPKDIGKRLAALSKADRAEVSERVFSGYEILTGKKKVPGPGDPPPAGQPPVVTYVREKLRNYETEDFDDVSDDAANAIAKLRRRALDENIDCGSLFAFEHDGARHSFFEVYSPKGSALVLADAKGKVVHDETKQYGVKLP